MASVLREMLRERTKEAKVYSTAPFIQPGAIYRFRVNVLKVFKGRKSPLNFVAELVVVERKLTITEAEVSALPLDKRPNAIGSSASFLQDLMTDWGPGLVLGFVAALLDESVDNIRTEENGTTLIEEVAGEANPCKDLEIWCEAYVAPNKKGEPSTRTRWTHISAPAGHSLAATDSTRSTP